MPYRQGGRVKAGGEKRPDFSVPRGRRFRDFSRKGGASADLFGKRGTLLISCGILSPVYQTFALFVVYAAFPHLTLL